MKSLATMFLVTMLGLSAATIATSQTLGGEGPPVDQIAADLGVSTADYQNCAPNERPAQGERPSREEHEARLNTLASCLQSANPSLDAQAVDAVMQNYRPAPPDRG